MYLYIYIYIILHIIYIYVCVHIYIVYTYTLHIYIYTTYIYNIYVRMSWAGLNWDSTNGLAGSATMVWPGKGILSVAKISHLNPAYSVMSQSCVFWIWTPTFPKYFPLFLDFCDSKPQFVQVVPSSFPMFSLCFPPPRSPLPCCFAASSPALAAPAMATPPAARPRGRGRIGGGPRREARNTSRCVRWPRAPGRFRSPCCCGTSIAWGRNGWDMMGWLARFFCEWVELGVPCCAFDFLPCVLCMVWLGLEQTGVGLQRRDPGDSTLTLKALLRADQA